MAHAVGRLNDAVADVGDDEFGSLAAKPLPVERSVSLLNRQRAILPVRDPAETPPM
jgi:hypothetical protein